MTCLNPDHEKTSGRKKARKTKVRRGQKTGVHRHSELATRERARQLCGIIIEQEPESPSSRAMIRRARARCECKLDVYRLQNKISGDEFKAGMHYRSAWLYQVEGIKTRDPLEREGGGIFMTDVERKSWAEEILNEAHGKAGLTLAQAQLVERVCGTDEVIGMTGSIRTLHRALDKLSRYWGFV